MKVTAYIWQAALSERAENRPELLPLIRYTRDHRRSITHTVTA